MSEPPLTGVAPDIERYVKQQLERDNISSEVSERVAAKVAALLRQ